MHSLSQAEVRAQADAYSLASPALQLCPTGHQVTTLSVSWLRCLGRERVLTTAGTSALAIASPATVASGCQLPSPVCVLEARCCWLLHCCIAVLVGLVDWRGVALLEFGGGVPLERRGSGVEPRGEILLPIMFLCLSSASLVV